MKLAEKIQVLRKRKGYSQEELLLNGVKEISACGSNAIKQNKAVLYEGH